LLYALRILAGGYAAEVSVSQWLITFSMFFFLSLACVKRFSELRAMRLNNKEGSQGRGYLASDLEQLSQFGTASGYLSVLVLALYISSREVSVLYARPQVIWLLCPVLLYWVSRIWLLASRGLVHEDPIVFAIGDRVSYVVGLISVSILLVAL
jgi:4-hydroxybenzoate polyprenyltransferase